MDDILTYEEALNSSDYVDYKGEDFDESYPWSIAEKALETGKIRVYSSHPIEQGTFVSPSIMEAESYSPDGKVYSKVVSLTEVAWVDPTQGQYAKVEEDISYSLREDVEEVADKLSGTEWKQVLSAVADYRKRNYHYEKSADGDIIIPIDNKLVYTDANFDDPGISKIIEIDSDIENEIDYARRWIYGAEKGKYTLAEAYDVIEDIVGNEIINEYSEKSGKTAKGYDRRTGRGKSRSDSYHSGYLQDRIRRANEIIASVNQESEEKMSLPEAYDNLKRENEKLLREHETFKQIIDSMENTLDIKKGMKGVKISDESIGKVAERMLRRYKSSMDKGELSERISTLFEGVTRGEMTAGDFEMVAEDVIRPMIEQSKNNLQISEYARDVLKEVKRPIIKLSTAQKKEAAYRYGSYGDYRKSLFGKANLSDKGTSLDTLWKQWSETYPNLFDESTGPEDQPKKLAEIVNALKTDYTDEFGFDLDDAVSYAAMVSFGKSNEASFFRLNETFKI